MADQDIKEIYVDGVGFIAVVGGVIRADLVRYSNDKRDKDGNPAIETVQRIVTSPQGFLQLSNSVNNLMQKMVESGMLKQNPAADDNKKEEKKKK